MRGMENHMGEPLKVMFSTGPDGPRTNPFIPLLKQAVAPQVVAYPFSWGRFLTARYDLLHVHWLEEILRGRNRFNQSVKPLLFALGLVIALITRRRIVSTVHNLKPHEPVSGLQDLAYKFYEAVQPRRIFLSRVRNDGFNAERDVLIPHGHYRPLLNGRTSASSAGSSVDYLTFGRVKPYKGITGLLAAVEGVEATFRIVGSCDDAATRANLHTTASRLSNLTVLLDYVSDDELLHELASARVALLPYGDMYNSGAVLLALSVGRPVVVPDTETNRQLRDEVGHGWMHLYSGRFDAGSLPDIDSLVVAIADKSPKLALREWDVIGRQHVAFYREVSRGRSWPV